MPGDKSVDDVIRIRVDTSRAVAEFLELLAEQAAAGETRAPAKPANRAVYRELAPFRLVEYSYVDPELDGIDGVFVGFPGGAIFSVTEDIPEEAVDELVDAPPAELPPLYIHIVLAEPATARQIEHFLKALSFHMDRPLVAVVRDEDGRMAARGHDGDHPAAASPHRAELEADMVKSVLEADMHLSKVRVLERFAARSQCPDGRAYAQITYNFNVHPVEFDNAADRNDFLAWSRTLCEWIYARWANWDDLGFSEILRPAEIATAPGAEHVVTRLQPPTEFRGGRPWQAFGGTSAADAQSFAHSDAATDPEAMRQSLALAKEYWAYVRETIDGNEAAARRRALKPV